jgi:hypothetical protein
MTLLFICFTTTFFFNTWEEYYTGKLELPLIHGVSEGCVVCCAICIWTGIYGQNIWLEHFMLFGYEFKKNEFMVAGIFWVSQPYNVFR